MEQNWAAKTHEIDIAFDKVVNIQLDVEKRKLFMLIHVDMMIKYGEKLPNM